MGLYITRSGSHDNGFGIIPTESNFTMYIPFEKPLAAANVIQVTADGDELQQVIHSFSQEVHTTTGPIRVSSIPLPSPITGHSVVTWRGDIAKFIVDNLA